MRVGEVSNEHIFNIFGARLFHEGAGHNSPLVGFVLIPNMHPQVVASYPIFIGDLTLLNIWVFHCAEQVAACVPLLSHIEFQLGKARLLGSMWTRSNKVSLVGMQQIPKSIHWLGYGSGVKLKYARNNAKLYANNAGVYGYLWAIVGPLPFTSQRMKMRGQTFVVGPWEFFC